MLALMRMSNRNDGIGMIMANTMPSTASGTANSERFPNWVATQDDPLAGFAKGATVPPRAGAVARGFATPVPETGAI